MAATAIDLQPYASFEDAGCDRRIAAAREALGERIVTLGHHYQRDEVFKHADFSGGSLELSREAAASSAEYLSVPADIAENARTALQRMLEI